MANINNRESSIVRKSPTVAANISDQLRLGAYELQEELGRGGWGLVYKARDQLGRNVAVKVLTHFGDDKTTIDAFKQEATTIAKLRHPNIVNVYQFGVDRGTPFLVMEYLDGRPLSSIIKSRFNLHLSEQLDIIIQAATGLQHAHENKIIHRDIKPHNLIVTEKFAVKLVDFGLAQGDDVNPPNVAGTLPYMSPQHFTSKRTPWCDVFSLGVVLFELLTRSLPYASNCDHWQRALAKITGSDTAPPLSRFISGYPPELEKIVGKALCKDPAGGYATAEDFSFALSGVQDLVKPQFLRELVAKYKDSLANGRHDRAHRLMVRVLQADPRNPDIRTSKQVNDLLDRYQQAAAAEDDVLANSLIVKMQALDELQSEQTKQGHLSMVRKRLDDAMQAGNLRAVRILLELILQLDFDNTPSAGFHVGSGSGEAKSYAQELEYACRAADNAITTRDFREAKKLIALAKKIDGASTAFESLEQKLVTAKPDSVSPRKRIESESRSEHAVESIPISGTSAQTDFTSLEVRLFPALRDALASVRSLCMRMLRRLR